MPVAATIYRMISTNKPTKQMNHEKCQIIFLDSPALMLWEKLTGNTGNGEKKDFLRRITVESVD